MPLPGFSSKTTATTFDKAKVVRAAEKNLSQGKISAAIKEYRKLVDFDAKDFMALNMLGDLYVRQDKKEDAIACFSKIADHYREQGFALKAIAMYKKIDRLTPNTPQIAFRLAGLYAQLGMVVEARSEYLIVAEAYTRSGQTQKALEILRRIADLDPHNAEVRLKLAESYLREGFRQEAAEAFTEGGNQLAGQGHHERAQWAFNQTLNLFPEDTPALKGIVGTHIALGTANEAAEMLETALAERPGDTELLDLLVKAYIEEKDAAAAEGAVLRLLERQPTGYQDFVPVARLYLKAGETEAAVRVIGRIVEPMLAAREDATLLELLQEALDRDPDQIQALHLLIRIHTWQRDDERLRSALDRLAEAAEAAGLADEERSALKQLLRFAPSEERYHNRLRELGVLGNPFGAPPKPVEVTTSSSAPVTATPGEVEVPTFESFMLAYEEPKGVTQVQEAKTGKWNEEPSASPDPNSSFADLNDEYGAGAIIEGNGASPMPGIPSFADLNPDLEEGLIAGSPGFQTTAEETAAGAQDERGNEQVIKQELDSVDFYLAQGYNDIAQDTLDMLERQYGSHPEISARRKRLQSLDTSAASTPAADLSLGQAEVEFQGATRYDVAEEVDASSFMLGAEDLTFATPTEEADLSFATPESATTSLDEDDAALDLIGMPQTAQPARTTAKKSAPAQKKKPQAAPQPAFQEAGITAGLDPGLADIFSEFATAIEAETPPQDADYETHYNLGLAFQEMDLWDDSIEELQTAIGMVTPHDGTSRYLQCCNMLGHCFMKKNMMPLAIMWFKKGLAAPGHTEDEYQALRYELATAYERMGDLNQAIDVFTEVYGVNVSYRGVSRKIEELQAQRAAQ